MLELRARGQVVSMDSMAFFKKNYYFFNINSIS